MRRRPRRWRSGGSRWSSRCWSRASCSRCRSRACACERKQLVAALAVVIGLALFVTIADPAGGRGDATPAAWVAIFAACAGGVRRLFGAEPSRSVARRGVLLGVSAALTKVVVARLIFFFAHAARLARARADPRRRGGSLERSQASLRAGTLGTASRRRVAFDALTAC